MVYTVDSSSNPFGVLCRNDVVEVFFIFTFSRGIYWRFLVGPFSRSVGMTGFEVIFDFTFLS